MSERWVNAHLEIVVPLDDASVVDAPFVKQEAIGKALDRLIEALPEKWHEYVMSARWEDVEDGEPIPPFKPERSEGPSTKDPHA